MQALAVIEPLDILHDRLPSLGLIAELPMPHLEEKGSCNPTFISRRGAGVWFIWFVWFI
jgi:hypothetical protein